MAVDAIAHADVVNFYPRRGLGYRHEKDHLALHGATRTLCGRACEDFPRSSGTRVNKEFDPSAPWACKACLRSLQIHGPVRVFHRISFWDVGTTTVVDGVERTARATEGQGRGAHADRVGGIDA
ncbi:hypothetical protein GKE82_24150 [Conexibacter sp. W3-3-2]|uniref:hypothetical protein n=1 Tax=Conexibacter sp. W3-3-2 TaxID=2675227 RepID=UPI0012B775D8|nr:hypothetical protein [Conexibacter sp. W3-3-2]MTD47301.1 hypothetical protein [Conexibacter sp. W3-3-2]